MKQLMITLVMCSIQISTNFALKSKVGFDGINDISFSELKQQHNQSISVADWKLFHNHLDKQYYIKHASNHFKKINYSELSNKPFGVTPHRYVVQEEIKRLIEERRQRNKDAYNPNLFHGSTWRCAWDRITGVHNKNHDSQNCIDAVTKYSW